HILTFFLAGLSHERQSFKWVSDDDDIAPNKERIRQLGEIWQAAVVGLVPHFVPTLWIGTKRDDEPTRSLSDLLAIPDLACGAWCQLLSRAGATEFIHGRPSVSSTLKNLPLHSLKILSWFAASGHPLKRLLCIIDEPLPDGKQDSMCSIPPALDGFRREIEKLGSGPEKPMVPGPEAYYR
ncbi:MAG: hypothetical protein LC667_20835, partial [Thioalkalivibrio sp.]|nr:hypothetical protein [Thioalkalivibrio sp.]